MGLRNSSKSLEDGMPGMPRRRKKKVRSLRVGDICARDHPLHGERWGVREHLGRPGSIWGVRERPGRPGLREGGVHTKPHDSRAAQSEAADRIISPTDHSVTGQEGLFQTKGRKIMAGPGGMRRILNRKFSGSPVEEPTSRREHDRCLCRSARTRTGMSVYDPISYGAQATSDKVDTRPIQAAVDEAHSNGGGTVLFRSGKTYLSGSIVLKTNVWLHVEAGSILQASGVSEDISPFRLHSADLREGLERHHRKVSRRLVSICLILYRFVATKLKISGFRMGYVG